MSMLSMMISFAPWLILKLLTVIPLLDPLTMLKIALSLATLVGAYQFWKDPVRGIISWGTLGFFTVAFVVVVVLTNMWVITHLGIIAQLMINAIAWGSMLLRRPFTIDYARLSTPEQYWTHPLFLRKNYLITGIWGCYFLLGFVTAEIRVYEPQISHLLLEIVDDSGMVGAMLYTTYASKHRSLPSVPAEGDAAAPTQTT